MRGVHDLLKHILVELERRRETVGMQPRGERVGRIHGRGVKDRDGLPGVLVFEGEERRGGVGWDGVFAEEGGRGGDVDGWGAEEGLGALGDVGLRGWVRDAT